jgi:hypothetical protein
MTMERLCRVLRYGLLNRSHVALKVLNTFGHPVVQLVNGEVEAGGQQSVNTQTKSS